MLPLLAEATQFHCLTCARWVWSARPVLRHLSSRRATTVALLRRLLGPTSRQYRPAMEEITRYPPAVLSVVSTFPLSPATCRAFLSISRAHRRLADRPPAPLVEARRVSAAALLIRLADMPQIFPTMAI